MVNQDAWGSAENQLALRRIQSWTGIGAVSAFVIIAFGSLVRATDSGLACPDWPLCYGELVPAFTWQIFFEWFHRLLAGLLAISLLVATSVLVRNRTLRSAFGGQLLAASVILAVQIVLGGLTVLKLLEPGIVSLHLLNAVVFLSILIWIYLKAKFLASGEIYSRPHKTPKAVAQALRVMTAAILVQLLLGGMVSTNGAGLVCPDFPQCFGMWWPPYSYLVNLQMTHRYLAFVLALFIFALSALSLRAMLPPITRWAMRLLPTLVTVQILLGIANVMFYLPVWASVAHLANAVAMYSLALCATLEVFFSSRAFAGSTIRQMAEQQSLSPSHEATLQEAP